MIADHHLDVRLGIAVLLTVVGCGLLIAGFTVPPVGIIDSSVLVAYGETCTFVGALIGIDYSYRYKIRLHKANDSNGK